MALYPQSASVKKLNLRHPEYELLWEMWEQIGTMYQGAVAMKGAVAKSGQFLIKMPKELPEVFSVRQERFSYKNLLGNVIGWYMSALFKQPPQLIKRVDDVTGPDALKVPKNVADFCAAFERNCDRAGLEFNDFMRRVSECCLLFRHAYVLVDLPTTSNDSPADVPALSLLEQQSQGLLNPFLKIYPPLSVLNWGTDDYGNLDWIKIYLRTCEQDFLSEPKLIDWWYIFDREVVALYRRDIPSGSEGAVALPMTGANEMATLEPGYPRQHAMSDQGRVPIRKVSLPEGLHLSARVFLPLINHLNQDNALDFNLMQCNIEQLVIEDGSNGSYEEPTTITPVGYHHMPNGGKIYFLAPSGIAHEASQKRLDNLEEGIYKTCYLTDQGRTNKSTPAAQSGLSKQMDKTPSRDALSGIGDVIRPAQQAIYADVLKIAGYEDIEPDVRGFDFADKAGAEEMTILEQSTVIEVNSETYEREVGKKAVRMVLADANTEILDVIDEEIDKNPTPSAQAALAQEQQRQTTISQFQDSLKANQAA